MISREEAQAKFNEYCGTLGPHEEVYTDGSKIDEKVGAAAVINRHFQNGEITCYCLSKRLTDNSTIFAAEATAITLALDYYKHMEPVRRDVVVYSDSMLCLQEIEGEDIENPLIRITMNLLWLFKGLITVGRELRQQHPSDLLSGARTSRERSSRDVPAGQQITRVFLP